MFFSDIAPIKGCHGCLFVHVTFEREQTKFAGFRAINCLVVWVLSAFSRALLHETQTVCTHGGIAPVVLISSRRSPSNFDRGSRSGGGASTFNVYSHLGQGAAVDPYSQAGPSIVAPSNFYGGANPTIHSHRWVGRRCEHIILQNVQIVCLSLVALRLVWSFPMCLSLRSISCVKRINHRT